ncbi:hypothetical protein [Nocardioides ultimimeridianus]
MFTLTAAPATPPPDNSVVAGPLGFAVFILLIAATAFICWSFTRQLKKVEKAKAAGVFGQDVADQMAREKADYEQYESPTKHDAEA